MNKENKNIKIAKDSKAVNVDLLVSPHTVELDNKRNIVYKQQKQAMMVSKVTCECNLTIPLYHVTRCYYCGEYYCEKCAAEHFGKSREQYLKEKNAG